MLKLPYGQQADTYKLKKTFSIHTVTALTCLDSTHKPQLKEEIKIMQKTRIMNEGGVHEVTQKSLRK